MDSLIFLKKVGLTFFGGGECNPYDKILEFPLGCLDGCDGKDSCYNLDAFLHLCAAFKSLTFEIKIIINFANALTDYSKGLNKQCNNNYIEQYKWYDLTASKIYSFL